MARQKNKLERLVRKNEDKEGGCINNKHASMQGGTDNLSSTAITSNAEFNSRSTAGTSTELRSTKDLTNKWVVNMSKIPLTVAQEKLLTHGPNFAITPRCPPIGVYIAVVEQSCQNLAQEEAEELGAEVKAVLKKIQPPKSNITKEEQRALKELKKDTNRVILTADKGTCLVFMDKEEYINKTQDLLKEETYRIIPEDPTNKQKNKLIQLLKKIKTEGGINEDNYKQMYPTGAGIPKFYGLPKVHKAGVPLKPLSPAEGQLHTTPLKNWPEY